MSRRTELENLVEISCKDDELLIKETEGMATEEDTSLTTEVDGAAAVNHIQVTPSEEYAPEPTVSTSDSVCLDLPVDEPETPVDPPQYKEGECEKCCTAVLQYRRLYAVVIVLLGIVLAICGFLNRYTGLFSPGIVLILAGFLVFIIDCLRKTYRKKRGTKNRSLLKAILTPRPDPRGKKKKKGSQRQSSTRQSSMRQSQGGSPQRQSSQRKSMSQRQGSQRQSRRASEKNPSPTRSVQSGSVECWLHEHNIDGLVQEWVNFSA